MAMDGFLGEPPLPTYVEVEFSSYRATTVACKQLATKMDELQFNYNPAAA
jgi:hypothetical protein